MACRTLDLKVGSSSTDACRQVHYCFVTRRQKHIATHSRSVTRVVKGGTHNASRRILK